MFNEHENEPNSKPNSLPADLAALEQRLAQHVPAAPRIDRDRLMFAAGQAAATYIARPSWLGNSQSDHSLTSPSWARSRFWPAATATMTAATVALATMLAWPSDKPETVVHRDSSTPIASVEVGPTTDTPNFSEDHRFHDTWRLSDELSSRYLTARGMISRDTTSLAHGGHIGNRDFESIDDSPREPATARSLLDELLPESTRQSQTNS